MNAEGDATRCHYRGLVKMEKVIGLFRKSKTGRLDPPPWGPGHSRNPYLPHLLQRLVASASGGFHMDVLGTDPLEI